LKWFLNFEPACRQAGIEQGISNVEAFCIPEICLYRCTGRQQ